MKNRITKIAAFIMVLVLFFTILPADVQASSSIKLNKSKITLYTGGTITLKVTGTGRKVTFTSSNKSVAAVNSQGKVTARKEGTAAITAKVGNKRLACRVTVKKENPKLSKRRITIYRGGTTTIKVTGTSRKVKFASSNKSVATVSSRGKVTARKVGTATITAKVGSKKITCRVTVKKENLKLDRSSLSLTVGESRTLKATGTSRKVSFSSSRKSVAAVNSRGKVTARKAGTAIITAETGSRKVSCKVTVKEKMPEKPVAKLNKTSDTVLISYSRKLSVSGNTGAVTWKSSDSSVAAVDSRGIVTGKKAGTVTITARVGGKNLTCKVTVPRYRLHVIDDRGLKFVVVEKDVRKVTIGSDTLLGQYEGCEFGLSGTKTSDTVIWELVGSKKVISAWGWEVDRNSKAGIDGSQMRDVKGYKHYGISNINDGRFYKNGSTELKVKINGKTMFTVKLYSVANR